MIEDAAIITPRLIKIARIDLPEWFLKKETVSTRKKIKKITEIIKINLSLVPEVR